MSTEGLILKWNDFEQNASLTFKNSKQNLDFSDVTLVAEDGQNIEAHKLIISSGCEFFSNMFNLNKTGNSIVFMRGVGFETLSAIVDFIYSGETKIPRRGLAEFLSIADDLKLRGLAKEEVLEECVDKMTKCKADEGDFLKSEIDQDHNQDSQPQEQTILPKISKNTSLKERNPEDKTDNVQFLDLLSRITDGCGDVKSREVDLNLLMTHLGGRWTCPICDTSCKTKQTLRTHIEGLHCSQLSYSCNLCEKVCKSKHALQCHVSKEHRAQSANGEFVEKVEKRNYMKKMPL